MPSAETIRKWNTNENWDDEFKQIAEKTQQKRIDKLSEELAKMDARQLKRLMKVYKKVDIHLGDDVVPNAQELLFVTKALETAIKNERLIRGQATERSESTQDVNIGWKDIIYASASQQTTEYEVEEDDRDFQSSDGGFKGLPEEIQQ